MAKEPLLAILPSDHRLARRKSIDPLDLVGETLYRRLQSPASAPRHYRRLFQAVQNQDHPVTRGRQLRHGDQLRCWLIAMLDSRRSQPTRMEAAPQPQRSCSAVAAGGLCTPREQMPPLDSSEHACCEPMQLVTGREKKFKLASVASSIKEAAN